MEEALQSSEKENSLYPVPGVRVSGSGSMLCFKLSAESSAGFSSGNHRICCLMPKKELRALAVLAGCEGSSAEPKKKRAALLLGKGPSAGKKAVKAMMKLTEDGFWDAALAAFAAPEGRTTHAESLRSFAEFFQITVNALWIEAEGAKLMAVFTDGVLSSPARTAGRLRRVLREEGTPADAVIAVSTGKAAGPARSASLVAMMEAAAREAAAAAAEKKRNEK